MAWWMAIPAAISAGAAIYNAVKGSKGGKSASYTPSSEVQGAISGSTPSQLQSKWGSMGGFAAPSQGNIDQSRDSQMGAIGMMRPYATGEKSAAMDMGRYMGDQNAANVMSQSNSAPWNPATQRQAINLASQQGQMALSQVVPMATQERQAAIQSMMQGYGQAREQDQAFWNDQARVSALQNQLQAQYMAMGMAKEQAAMQAQMALEQMKYQAKYGNMPSQLQQQQNDASMQDKLVGALGNMSSSMLGSMATDKGNK